MKAKWVDDGAGDTWENAARTARILGKESAKRIVLVTHSCHMGRAVAEFEAAGFSVVPAPVVVQPHAGSGIDSWLPTARGLLYANMGLYELVGRPVSAALRRFRR